MRRPVLQFRPQRDDALARSLHDLPFPLQPRPVLQYRSEALDDGFVHSSPETDPNSFLSWRYCRRHDGADDESAIQKELR